MPQAVPLWATSEMRQAAGTTLRPGGFALTDRAAGMIGVAPGWRVLDVGGGLGATVARLRSRFGAESWGVEPSSHQLKRAGREGSFVQAYGDTLPFQGEVFHAVFCECVLSLFEDAEAGLKEFHRVLAPDGFLVVADVCVKEGVPSSCGSCADRAVPLAAILDKVTAGGFAIHALEDHSNHLKNLAARLILAGRESVCSLGCGFGYYLMIAQKKGVVHAG